MMDSLLFTCSIMTKINVKPVQVVHIFLSRIKRKLYQWYYNIQYRKELKELAELEGKYRGRRCFVIGTGPSLTASDLEKLDSEFTFASNSIFRYFDKTYFRPDFYAVCDKTYYAANKEKCDSVIPKRCTFYPLDFALIYGFNRECRYFLRPYYSSRYPKFKVKPMRALEEGSTVTFYLLQLAVMMGFTDIYLLGVDFNYSTYKDHKGNIVHNDNVKDYAFNDKATNYTVPDLGRSYKAYCLAEDYCRQHNYNVRIYNATRGGKLEIFKRVDLDEVLSDTSCSN